MSTLTFKKLIWDYYKKHGRNLPWRRTRDPYRILVSEIMLQQTQVVRVIPKYQVFLKRFPTFSKLAYTQLGDVLKTWQGLGYNRRAKYLWTTAQQVIMEHGGKLPSDPAILQKLPGIGPNTAGALVAFAFNKPVVFIETNIRSVFIHEFFKNKRFITDKDILLLIERTCPAEPRRSREWYYALMDYGAMLKATKPNPSRRSVHHSRQSQFEGSNRQLRGAIIRILAATHDTTAAELTQLIDFPMRRIKISLTRLTKEGLIASAYGRYRLA